MGEKIVWKKSYFSKRIFERSCNLPSKIVHPLPPSGITDRSILLATHLRNEGYFCFVSRLRSTRRGSKCFKGSTLILFQLQKSASESKKVCSRTNRRAWIFAPFEVRYIVLWSHLLLPFFLSFFFYYYYSIVCCVQVSVPFDGMETRKNRLEEIYGVLFLLEGSGIFWIFQFLENNEPLIETMDFSFRFKREAKD